MNSVRTKHPTIITVLVCCALALTSAVAVSAPAKGPTYSVEAIEAYRRAIELNPDLIASIEDPRLSKVLGEQFLADGIEYLDAGDLISAEKKLLVAGNFHESFSLFKALARCYFRQERWEASLVLYRKALKRQPRNADVRAEMARAFLRIGKEEQAVRLYCQALVQNSALARFIESESIKDKVVSKLVGKARKLSEKERHVDAAAHLKVAVTLDAKPKLYLEVGQAYVKAQNPKAAARAFALAVREKPALIEKIRRPSLRIATGRELFERGVDAYKEGVFDQAEKLFILSNKLDERGATVYNLADCAVRLKRIDDAVELYNKAVALSPDLKNAYLNVAIIYIDKGMTSKAVNKLRRLITRSPATVEAYELLARAFLKQGKEDEAAGAYRTAIEYDISLQKKLKNQNLRTKAADSLYTSAKEHYTAKRYQEALADIAGAQALRKEGRFQFLAGNVHYGLGNLQKALGCYEKAIAISPGSPKILNNMGNLYLKLGDYAKAIDTFQRAVQVDPNYAQAYNNLGICLRKRGLVDEAIVAYKRALKLKPDYAAAHFNLGNAYAAKCGASKTK